MVSWYPVRNASNARYASNAIDVTYARDIYVMQEVQVTQVMQTKQAMQVIQIMEVRLAHPWVEFRVSDLQFENEKNRRIETSGWLLKPTGDDSFIRNM